MTCLPVRAERLLSMRDEFEHKSFLSVGELVAALGASPMTVRRDLRRLAEEGAVTLVHGGAVRMAGSPMEKMFDGRQLLNVAEKSVIGGFAAKMAYGCGIVGLDGGTTALALARALRPTEQLTVVTHSLPVMAELADRPHIDLMGLGGFLQAHTLAFAGPSIAATLRRVHLQTLFLSTTGFTLEGGMTCVSIYETETKRALIAAAERVVLITDHSKLGRVFAMHVASLDVVHDVVIDAGLPDEARYALEKRGIRVHIVDAAATAGVHGEGVRLSG